MKDRKVGSTTGTEVGRRVENGVWRVEVRRVSSVYNGLIVVREEVY